MTLFMKTQVCNKSIKTWTGSYTAPLENRSPLQLEIE